MHGFSCLSEATELLLSISGELRGFGGRQLAGSPGVTRGGAPLTAELELKLGESGHDGSDGTACWCAGIYTFAQGAQHNSALAEIGDGAGYLGDGAPEPIDGSDDNDIALSGVSKHGGKARPIGVHRTGEFVGEDAVRVDAGYGERTELGLQVLAGGADSCVAEGRRHAVDCLITTDSGDLRHAM